PQRACTCPTASRRSPSAGWPPATTPPRSSPPTPVCATRRGGPHGRANGTPAISRACSHAAPRRASRMRSAVAMDYEVAIVGGGPNGLTAAAYLARSGTDVVVLERRFERGGAKGAGDHSTPLPHNHAPAPPPPRAHNPPP